MIHKITQFYLQRNIDTSGVSGTGIVAVGVILPSGTCIIEWCSYHSSIAYYKNIADVEAIHGHNGDTQIIMGEPKVPKATKRKKKANEQT